MRLASTQGKWLLAAMILGSGMAFLDGSIVGLALPAVDRDLGAGVAGLQWAVNAYTLTLAALIPVGGDIDPPKPIENEPPPPPRPEPEPM